MKSAINKFEASFEELNKFYSVPKINKLEKSNTLQLTIEISVVIPAYNANVHIYNCLKALEKQTFSDFEVILVDDCSKDNTVFLVNQFAKSSHFPIQVIRRKKHSERGVVRNLGARKAQGNYLLFIDVDMQLSPKVLEQCIGKIRASTKMKGIIIPEFSIGKGFWANCKRLEKKCYIGDESIEAARFFDKKTFWQAGGWDEKMISGEDWDLTRRVRHKFEIGRIKSPIYHNEGEINPLKTFQKKYYYASKSNRYFSQNPQNVGSIFTFVFRPAYFRNWRLLIADPIHALGMISLKLVELTAGVLGLFAAKISVR